MDLHELIRGWASTAIAALAFGSTILAGRGKAAKDEQLRLEGRITAAEQSAAAMNTRVAEIELTVRHLPTREQFHTIELSFERMNGEIKVLSGSMARIEKHLENRTGDGART